MPRLTIRLHIIVSLISCLRSVRIQGVARPDHHNILVQLREQKNSFGSMFAYALSSSNDARAPLSSPCSSLRRTRYLRNPLCRVYCGCSRRNRELVDGDGARSMCADGYDLFWCLAVEILWSKFWRCFARQGASLLFSRIIRQRPDGERTTSRPLAILIFRWVDPNLRK
jgi:hypothetical protein